MDFVGITWNEKSTAGSSEASEDEEVPCLVEYRDNEQEIVQEALTKVSLSNDTKSGSTSAVPVTIITGFLGSGKSTLLRYILSADHGLRIAVIENEFGDSMDIENIIATDGANGERIAGVFELRNGCVCCSVKDDLVETLDYLLEQREKMGLAFDRVLIETTGLANPGPVASVLWVDEELESRVSLDGIITLVDSKNIRRHLNLPDNTQGQVSEELRSKEAMMQIAYADRVILNKKDLVSSEDIAQLRQIVRRINEECEVMETSQSRVSLDWILQIKSLATWNFKLKSEQNIVYGVEDDLLPPLVDSGCSCTAHASDKVIRGANGSCKVHNEDTSHDPLVTTESFLIPGVIRDIDSFEHWLGELLWEKDEAEEMEVYRMKGLFSVKDKPGNYILQSVFDLFELTERINDVPEIRENRQQNTSENCYYSNHVKLVVIGRCLNRSSIESGLAACCDEL
mmetsp:Transcript_15469/g.20424  ORF Transcript_15469/g.20424 Transcript_15469/m.20424 type:complete len:456 (-) Transcript_15469:119-1486(-)